MIRHIHCILETKNILNFDVPVSNDLQLGVSGPNSGLYRNNSGTNYHMIWKYYEITSSMLLNLVIIIFIIILLRINM